MYTHYYTHYHTCHIMTTHITTHVISLLHTLPHMSYHYYTHYHTCHSLLHAVPGVYMHHVCTRVAGRRTCPIYRERDTHRHTKTHKNTYKYTHTHAHTHTRTHTHTHTHTHTPEGISKSAPYIESPVSREASDGAAHITTRVRGGCISLLHTLPQAFANYYCTQIITAHLVTCNRGICIHYCTYLHTLLRTLLHLTERSALITAHFTTQITA